MPFSDQWGYPPYDETKPMGGWDAETWMRYRKQQRDRAYPGQFPSKTEQLERNARRSAYKRAAAIAKIDATLARNTLGERPPAAPDGRRSGAQIEYDIKVASRARLQAQRDRLAALSGRAASTPTTIGTPQATAPATGANAYTDPATGIPIAKAAAASGANPAAVAQAAKPIAFSGPQPPTVTALTTAERAAIDGMVGSLGSAYATPGTRQRRAGDGEPTVIVTGTPQVQTRRAGAGEPTVIVTTPKVKMKPTTHTPKSGKGKDESAPLPKKTLPAQSKAVDQDQEARRAKEQQANKLRSSKAWSKGKTIPPPKGFNNTRRPVT